MEKKLWYAVLKDADDLDYGYGSFDLTEAINMAKPYCPDAQIAVIDGDYDVDGIAQTDPICINILSAEDCL